MKITAHLNVRYFSQQPRINNVLFRVDKVGCTFPLRANLHNAVVLPGDRHHRFPFDDVDADGLLHPDVRSGLDGSETVIINGLQRAQEGAKVAPEMQEVTATPENAAQADAPMQAPAADMPAEAMPEPEAPATQNNQTAE